MLGYRLTDKDADSPSVFPDAVNDVAAGVNWLWNHSSELIGTRPSKALLIGHSAGAQLTGLVGLQKKWVCNGAFGWIKGVVSIEGILDIPALAVSHPKFVPWFLDLQFPDKDKWTAASPHHVEIERDSHFKYAVVYSKDDEFEMEQQSVAFYEKLKCKLEAVYVDTLGGSHDGTLNQQNLVDFIAVFASKL
jgi:acetyl esterase/lipase